MDELLIGEVARRAGLRPSAVRYYERRGLLPPPRRVNGRRRYTPDIVQALTLIQFGRRVGFTLAEIRHWVRDPSEASSPSAGWRELAREKLVQLDARIEHLHKMKAMLNRGIRCDCQRLESCAIMDRGWWSDQEPFNASLWQILPGESRHPKRPRKHKRGVRRAGA